MVKRSIARKRKKRNRKKWVVSPPVPLCALGEVLRAKSVFQSLHAGINIPQKTIVYRPTDKLVFVVLGMLSGAETVYEINTRACPDRALLEAFGYDRCADALVIHETLNAATLETMVSLEFALSEVRLKQCAGGKASLGRAEERMCVDIDLSAYRLVSMLRDRRKGTLLNPRTPTPGSSPGRSAGIRKRSFLTSYTQVMSGETLFSRRCWVNLRTRYALRRWRTRGKFACVLMPDLAQMRISIMRSGGV